MPASILAVDFGGTRTRAGLFEHSEGDLRLIRREETLSRVDEPQSVVIERIIGVAHAVTQGADVHAVGISAPGPLDPFAGVIHHARTLPNWHNVPLAAILSETFRAPAHMQNDGNLAALAEYHRGAGQGCDPLVYLTLSTGIGGGVVIGGRLFSGWSGLASEPGHQLVPLDAVRLARLEDVASGTAIGQRARTRLTENNVPSLLRAAPTVDGKAVGEAAAAGDAFALEIVREAGRALGIGLANLLHILSPRAVVVGGSVAQLGNLLFEPAMRVVREFILDPRFVPDDLLRPAALGDDVCLYGAAYYALREGVFR